MNTDFEVLIDSDAFVGLFVQQDSLHSKVQMLFKKFAHEECKLVTTSFVVAETATVISRHVGQEAARRFLTYIRSGVIPVIFVNEGLQEAAEQIFMSQQNKRTSMVDCSNVAVIELLNIPMIFSFDEFYFKKFHLQRAA